MIAGLGNDIIEIKRIKEAYEEHKEAFLNRLYTEKEQEYCMEQENNPFPRLAGRFAAKEAIVKALGCGFGSEVSWKDIEIIPDENGKPEVHLSDELSCRFDHPILLVTISHCKEYATAVAIRLKN